MRRVNDHHLVAVCCAYRSINVLCYQTVSETSIIRHATSDYSCDADSRECCHLLSSTRNCEVHRSRFGLILP